MVPRLWIVTDSEARHLIDREPFASLLKGIPEQDRMAVVRLGIEAYRRERLTRVGTKRPLRKCIDHAAYSYRQWRDERPDDYQLWRELIYTPRTTTTGSVDVSTNNPSRLETRTMQVEVGYLVTLHLFPGDDLPQRWFSRREDAFEYARNVCVDELVSTFDYCVDGRELEGQPLSVTEFHDGVPEGVTWIGRADFPEVMGVTPCLSNRDAVTDTSRVTA